MYVPASPVTLPSGKSVVSPAHNDAEVKMVSDAAAKLKSNQAKESQAPSAEVNANSYNPLSVSVSPLKIHNSSQVETDSVSPSNGL